MPPRKRTSSVLNGDAKNHPTDDLNDADEAITRDDALALAEEAEAEAAEAEATAAAARARARAIRLRRQAGAAPANGTSATTPAAVEPAEVEQTEAVEFDEPVASETVADESVEATTADAETATDATDGDADDVDTADADTDDDEAAADTKRRRRLKFKLPGIGLKVVAAALVVLLSLGLLGAGGWMVWHHQQVSAEQQRSAEFAAAARQGVVTLMSLDFNHADEDVKRILDNTTGDFKKDFEGQAGEFADVAKSSKVTTQATVNSTAVQTMTKDTATVLVAVTTNVSNAASKQQEPRSWRLRVDVARDGGQIKLAKVEFVP
jgi:Mce-associated membrane protein